MTPREYGRLVEGQGAAPVAPTSDARIDRISVFKHRAMVVHADGTNHVYDEGTPEHARLLALAATMPARSYMRHTEVTIYKWAS